MSVDDRKEYAKQFLELNRDWFSDERNGFYGLREIAERILQEWVDTNEFPVVNGIWIHFENAFLDWVNSHDPTKQSMIQRFRIATEFFGTLNSKELLSHRDQIKTSFGEWVRTNRFPADTEFLIEIKDEFYEWLDDFHPMIIPDDL